MVTVRELVRILQEHDQDAEIKVSMAFTTDTFRVHEVWPDGEISLIYNAEQKEKSNETEVEQSNF